MKRTQEKLYLGKYRAVVYSIEDPLKMRRIQVQCPRLSGDAVLDWALPCDAFPTDWLPVVGSYVWMEFEGGEIDRPIWVGLCRPKPDIHADFVSEYGSDYRRDHDDVGNTIEWTKDGGSAAAGDEIAIRINEGTKRVATEDLLAWIKTNVLDWIKTNLLAPTGWLQTHVQPPPAGVIDPASIASLAALHAAWVTTITDYENKRGAGQAHLTNKFVTE